MGKTLNLYNIGGLINSLAPGILSKALKYNINLLKCSYYSLLLLLIVLAALIY